MPIRNGNMDYAIARHKEKNDGPATSLKFIGIERVLPSPRGGNLIKQLLRREAYWIHELNTVEPNGLNKLHFCERLILLVFEHLHLHIVIFMICEPDI